MARFSDQHAQFTGDVSMHGYRLRSFSQVVAFGDLGSGASDTIALADFPLGVVPVRARVEVIASFEGEADLAVTVGDTADADGLMESVDIDQVVAGTILEATGAEQGWSGFEADMATDGLAATFTATELDDVTAGSLRVRVLYLQPIAVL